MTNSKTAANNVDYYLGKLKQIHALMENLNDDCAYAPTVQDIDLLEELFNLEPESLRNRRIRDIFKEIETGVEVYTKNYNKGNSELGIVLDIRDHGLLNSLNACDAILTRFGKVQVAKGCSNGGTYVNLKSELVKFGFKFD